MRHYPTTACVVLPANPASLLTFAHEADQRPLEPTPAKLIGKPIVCSCLTHDEGVPATTTGLAMARAALGAGGAAMFLQPDLASALATKQAIEREAAAGARE